MTRNPRAAANAAHADPLAVPLVLGLRPVSESADEGPLAWLWHPDDARELDAHTDEMIATEDVLVLISTSAPRADIAHALRALAAVIEEGIELQLKINDAYELPAPSHRAPEGEVTVETRDGGGTNGVGKPHLSVVSMPQKRGLVVEHVVELRASGLTDETIELANLYTEHRATAIAELLRRRTFPRHHGWALVFPLYMPGATEPYDYRVKPKNPRTHKRGKAIKYEQADQRTAGVLVYFPPRARRDNGAWYRDAERGLLWTEGEKKALGLDQLEFPTIGLTGVWNWLDVAHRDETGEWRLHPLIREHVTIAGRRHVIVFDADARENDQVMNAAQRLAGVLLAAGATEVRFVCPPSREHKGIDDYYAAFGEASTRALLDAAGEIEPLDPTSPLQLAKRVRALKDAPINDQLRLPEGYEIQRDGSLWKLASDDKHGNVKIASRPILIVRHLADYYTHEARVEICYERDDKWITSIANRRALADARTMVAELAPIGVPVTSNSAPKIVDWLEELEQVNGGVIPRDRCIGRTGWHTVDDERAFVLDRPYFAEDRERAITLDARGDRRKLFAALAARGDSLQQHIDALKRAWEADPVCAAMIAGALAATLLEPLDVPNFAIHLAGDSSRGKSSQLKIAASVFGDPNCEAWLGSWNTTGVAAELRAQQLTDLPQCYDEVGVATDPASTERMLYGLVNGGGRARGKADLSLRETPTWRTVVLSTGERPLADESSATGAQVRVIQFPVSGFGKLAAAEVDEVREACIARSGMFGRRWIENLLEIDDWAPFRASHKTITKKLRESASDPLQGRIAGYFATLITAEIIAHRLGLGLAGGATIHELFKNQARREAVRTVAERAIDLVRGWLASEPDAFPEIELRSDGTEEAKNRPGVSASKARHGFRKGNLLLLIPDAARSFFEQRRLSVREVMHGWQARGWLEHDSGRLTHNLRLGATTQRLYALDLDKADLEKSDSDASAGAGR